MSVLTMPWRLLWPKSPVIFLIIKSDEVPSLRFLLALLPSSLCRQALFLQFGDIDHSSFSSYLPGHSFWISCSAYTFFKKKILYLFIFRQRGREGEKYRCVTLVGSHTPLTGDLTSNPGMCPDPGSNWRPFGLQAGAQSTESHQPGLSLYF